MSPAHGLVGSGAAVLTAADTADALIGPNTVIQTLRVVHDLAGPETRDRLARQTGLDGEELAGLIPESAFVRLLEATRGGLPAEHARAVEERAGAETARYVAHHRIPGFFRAALGMLPARFAIPLLLLAFRRHAWTFSGRSGFAVTGDYPGCIVLDDAPTCRHVRGTASGLFYASAFEGLLALASPDVKVTEVACRGLGARACHFLIQLEETSSGD